ncbi:MAG: hypothetical protein ACOC1W_04735 [Bacillota bacterium]
MNKSEKRNKIKACLVIGLIFSCFFGLFLFSSPQGIMAQSEDNQSGDKMNIKSDKLTYDPETGVVNLTANVRGNYGVYHFLGDEIILKLEDGEEENLRTPEEISMSPGGFTGCDLEHPHYLFKASTIEIYPGDYLVAYNVVFYEFNGRLPLFYWPILYINLDDDRSNIEFEYGYSSLRGWYGKLTYNYNIFERPGQLYFDYYQNTGKAYGIKQHYIHTDNNQGYLYYYTQDNKIDLDSLFDWEATLNHDFNWQDWEANAFLNFQQYNQRDVTNADFYLNNQTDEYEANFASDFERLIYYDDNRNDRQNTNINLGYDRNFASDLDIYIDYDLELTDYLNREDLDQQSSDLQLGLYKGFEVGLNLGADYSREIDHRVDDDLNREEQAEFEADYNWGQGWGTEFNYEYGRLFQSQEDLQERWSSYFSVGREVGRLNYNLVLERNAPGFGEEGVSFYRWPEFNLNYSPPGFFEYRLQLGRYYEDQTDIEGYRGAAGIGFNNRWQFLDRFSLRSSQELTGLIYRVDEVREGYPRALSYDSEVDFETRIFDNWTFTNSHKYLTAFGETPFNFDEIETEEVLESELRYSRDRIDFTLDSGYDLIDFIYLPLTAALTLRPNDDWRISVDTEYDLNEREFTDDLRLSSRYRGVQLTATTSLDYDLNEYQFYRIRNQLDYEVPGDYGWSISNRIRYDFNRPQEDRLREASIALRKSIHCRELRFSYDHIDREFVVSYHLDLFGGRGLSTGRSEEEGFLFEIDRD